VGTGKTNYLDSIRCAAVTVELTEGVQLWGLLVAVLMVSSKFGQCIHTLAARQISKKRFQGQGSAVQCGQPGQQVQVQCITEIHLCSCQDSQPLVAGLGSCMILACMFLVSCLPATCTNMLDFVSLGRPLIVPSAKARAT
jgi:hypothetical protein